MCICIVVSIPNESGTLILCQGLFIQSTVILLPSEPGTITQQYNFHLDT